jgi:hypothetical protein
MAFSGSTRDGSKGKQGTTTGYTTAKADIFIAHQVVAWHEPEASELVSRPIVTVHRLDGMGPRTTTYYNESSLR